MGVGLRVGGPVTIYRCLAGGNVNGVGEVDGHEIPFCIWHHEGESPRDVMRGTHAASVRFGTLCPCLKVLTRGVNE